MDVTDWYSGKHPIRDGWYERDYSQAEGFFEHGGQTIYLDLWMQTSPGKGFWYVINPSGKINDAWWQNLPWRGLNGE